MTISQSLISQSLLSKLPRLYATEGSPDARVWVKLFDPCSQWVWYAVEADPATGICFGFVKGFEEELGYFSLRELEQVRNKLGLPLEADLSWDDATTLRQVLNGDVR